MSCLNVKFLKQDYVLPKDLLKYISMQMVTDASAKYIDLKFRLKIKSGIEVVDDTNFMDKYLEEKAAYYIETLCKNDIYDRTVSDYMSSSKGIDLIHSVNKDCLNYLVQVRKDKNSAYLSGINDAIYKKEAAVTGLDFGIISSSFVNHMIYATMEANAMHKQEKAAVEEYNRDIAELRSSLSVYDEKEAEYIEKIYVPSMNIAINLFVYEMFDKYISDMIKNNKLDGGILDYINIERSNDLLKNLSLSNNKEAVLRKAFEACPFNIAVYMNAMKYDMLDYDSYKTAETLIYGYKIKEFLEENLCEISYPKLFKVDYKCANLLAEFTDNDVKSILREKTMPYADGVFKQYRRVLGMINDKKQALNIMGKERDETLLAGDAISKGKAHAFVKEIASVDIWQQLIDCGHDLVADLREYYPDCPEFNTKNDFDQYLIDKLYTTFEEVRVDTVNSIKSREEAERKAKEEAEKRAKEEAERKAEQKRLAKEKAKSNAKKGGKFLVIAIIAVIAAFVLYRVWIKLKWDVIRPAQDYNKAIELMEDEQYTEAYDLFMYRDDYKDSAELALVCQYNYAKQLLDEKNYMFAAAEFSALGDYEDSEELQIKCTYLYGLSLIDSKDYSRAMEYFDMIPEYKDSAELYKECTYLYGLSLADNKDYLKAMDYFNTITEYKDSAEQYKITQYNYAVDLVNSEMYDSAIEEFEKLGDYKDSKDLIIKSMYARAERNREQNKLLIAADQYDELGEYEDCIEKAKECRYIVAIGLIDELDYKGAIEQLELIQGYKDSSNYLSAIKKSRNNLYCTEKYDSTYYIWSISGIDADTGSEILCFFRCKDDDLTDNEYIDKYYGSYIAWKTEGNKIYASENGEEAERYYLYTLYNNNATLTSKFISDEKTDTDTYKLINDNHAQLMKEEIANYLENYEDELYHKLAAAVLSITE